MEAIYQQRTGVRLSTLSLDSNEAPYSKGSRTVSPARGHVLQHSFSVCWDTYISLFVLSVHFSYCYMVFHSGNPWTLSSRNGPLGYHQRLAIEEIERWLFPMRIHMIYMISLYIVWLTKFYQNCHFIILSNTLFYSFFALRWSTNLGIMNMLYKYAYNRMYN